MTTNRTTYGGWLTAGFDLWMLGADAGAVIAMRMARIASGGPEGAAEAKLMVSEKVRAAIEIQTDLMAGTLGLTPIGAAHGAFKHVRRKVTANRQRLGRSTIERQALYDVPLPTLADMVGGA